MKKIVCILLCVFLLIPLLAISSFAEDSFSFTVTRNSNAPYIIQSYNGTSWTQIYASNEAIGSQIYNLTVRGVVCRIDSHFTTGYCTSDVWLNNVSVDHGSLDSPILLNDGDSFIVQYKGTQVVQGGREYTYFMWVLPQPMEELGINQGVSSSINFTGQVLQMITSNADILALVGLAIALGFAIPWGISKLKQAIKGY